MCETVNVLRQRSRKWDGIRPDAIDRSAPRRARAPCRDPRRLLDRNAASSGLSRSSTPSSSSPCSNGTTISERDAESQAMWPGNSCTSGTMTVARLCAAVPHTPRPSAMRTHATLALKGPEEELTAAHKIKADPVQARQGFVEQAERLAALARPSASSVKSADSCSWICR